MKVYKKKPGQYFAMEWTGKNLDEVIDFCDGAATYEGMSSGGSRVVIQTLESDGSLKTRHAASVGDWIIKGMLGEYWPIKPEAFALTYEPAEFSGAADRGGVPFGESLSSEQIEYLESRPEVPASPVTGPKPRSLEDAKFMAEKLGGKAAFDWLIGQPTPPEPRNRCPRWSCGKEAYWKGEVLITCTDSECANYEGEIYDAFEKARKGENGKA